MRRRQLLYCLPGESLGLRRTSLFEGQRGEGDLIMSGALRTAELFSDSQGRFHALTRSSEISLVDEDKAEIVQSISYSPLVPDLATNGQFLLQALPGSRQVPFFPKQRTQSCQRLRKGEAISNLACVVYRFLKSSLCSCLVPLLDQNDSEHNLRFSHAFFVTELFGQCQRLLMRSLRSFQMPLKGKHAPDIVQDRGRSERVTNLAEDRQGFLVPRFGTNQVSPLPQQVRQIIGHPGHISSIPSRSIDLLSFLIRG